MQDILIYKQKDLVLKVNNNFDPTKLRLDDWIPFIERLCGNREYQKAAIKSSIIYLASGRYKSIEDLFEENFQKNNELQSKYTSLANFKSMIQIPNKLFANIDLATGTGKSYVIYGVAQIMLGLGLIDKVLVLCPSLTIEAGLMEKFEELSGNARLRATIPEDAHYKNPVIIDANKTIKDGDICVENIHAVYERTGSSIEDSLVNNGERVLVLNDEAHHIFNKPQSISASSNEGKGIKKWKEFLIDPNYGFKYILGFTGTAYHENEYFNDVIFRYSLREAIEDRVVKNIEYVQKDDSSGISEKFQKIYQNHLNNSDQYPEIKPLSILITKDISKAKALKDDLVDFLIETEDIIPRVLYLQVQEEMKRRSLLFKGKDGKRRIYSSKYALSSITFCSDCGDIYRRTYWNNRGKKSTVWRCVTRLEEGPRGCTSRTISEEDLHAAVAEAFNQVLGGGESMIAILRENIESVVCESNEQAIANIDKQMEEKQMELISYANSGKDYEKLADEIQVLSERRQAILTAEAESQGEKDRITEMMDFIENHADQNLDYDEELVRLLVEKATIFENNVVVRFKSGIEVEI